MKFSIRRINELLLLIVGFVLCSVIISALMGTFIRDYYSWNNLLNPMSSGPLISAATQDAIAAFSGDETNYLNWKLTLIIFLNVGLYLFVGPWLLYKGFVKSRVNEEFKKPWHWYVGGIVCIASFSIIPITVKNLIVSDNVNASVNESRTIDKLREEVFDVSYALALQVISNMNSENSVDYYTTTHSKGEFNFHYETVIPDSSFIITGTHAGYELSVKAEIKPFEEDFLIIRN